MAANILSTRNQEQAGIILYFENNKCFINRQDVLFLVYRSNSRNVCKKTQLMTENVLRDEINITITFPDAVEDLRTQKPSEEARFNFRYTTRYIKARYSQFFNVQLKIYV